DILSSSEKRLRDRWSLKIRCDHNVGADLCVGLRLGETPSGGRGPTHRSAPTLWSHLIFKDHLSLGYRAPCFHWFSYAFARNAFDTDGRSRKTKSPTAAKPGRQSAPATIRPSSDF